VNNEKLICNPIFNTLKFRGLLTMVWSTERQFITSIHHFYSPKSFLKVNSFTKILAASQNGWQLLSARNSFTNSSCQN